MLIYWSSVTGRAGLVLALKKTVDCMHLICWLGSQLLFACSSENWYGFISSLFLDTNVLIYLSAILI